MYDMWFCSDHHIGHKSIIQFKGPEGEDARTIFDSIEEHNETLIENHNSVVSKNDKVYMLGDVCWNSSSVKLIKRMNGNKVLIMGNHDKQRVNSYLSAFGEIKGAMYFGQGGINSILTHIPVHPCQLKHRFKYNIHGHLHSYNIQDPRYLNVSMEQINYTPINLEEVINRLNKQEQEWLL